MYCITYNGLLNAVCIASERFQQSLKRLLEVTAKGTAAAFELAHSDCETCRAECQHSKAYLKAHRAFHGC